MLPLKDNLDGILPITQRFLFEPDKDFYKLGAVRTTELAQHLSLQSIVAQVMLGCMTAENKKRLDSLIQDYSKLRLDRDLIKITEEALCAEAEWCKKELLAAEEKLFVREKSLEAEIAQPDNGVSELRAKLTASDAEVTRLTDVNENIELRL